MAFFSRRQRMGAAAILLAASAFLSRIMGLLRDKIISWQFGASHEADMYFAAFVVPDIINYLLAGGFMSITIIPLLARAFANDRREAWRFFSCVFFWMVTAACLLTGLGEIFAQPLAKLVAPGFNESQTARLAFFMRIILPAQVFFLGGACFTALLFLRRQFAAPAFSPLIYNGCIILFGIMPSLLGLDEHLGMTGYCIGVTVGAALGAWALPLAIAMRGELRLHIAYYHPLLKRFFFIALPLMLGQTVIMLDEQFLRIFGSMLGEGAVSLLNYARRIAQVPIGLMGQAIAVASYPFLVRLLADGERKKFDDTLRSAFNAGICLIIPCAMWMIGTAVPILGIIFQGGRFGVAETHACAPLTQIMLAATPMWIIYMVISRAFYAHEDSLTPALTGTIVTVVCIPCYYLLALPYGTRGIAITSGISVTIYTLWLIIIWQKRYGGGAFAGLLRSCLQAFACSTPAAAASWYSTATIMRHMDSAMPILAYVIALGGSLISFGAIFIPAAMYMAPELSDALQNRLKALLKKS